MIKKGVNMNEVGDFILLTSNNNYFYFEVQVLHLWKSEHLARVIFILMSRPKRRAVLQVCATDTDTLCFVSKNIVILILYNIYNSS